MSLATRLFGNYHFNIGSNPEVFWEISQENTQDGVRGRFLTNFMKILRTVFSQNTSGQTTDTGTKFNSTLPFIY